MRLGAQTWTHQRTLVRHTEYKISTAVDNIWCKCTYWSRNVGWRGSTNSWTKFEKCVPEVYGHLDKYSGRILTYVNDTLKKYSFTTKSGERRSSAPWSGGHMYFRSRLLTLSFSRCTSVTTHAFVNLCTAEGWHLHPTLVPRQLPLSKFVQNQQFYKSQQFVTGDFTKQPIWVRSAKIVWD